MRETSSRLGTKQWKTQQKPCTALNGILIQISRTEAEHTTSITKEQIPKGSEQVSQVRCDTGKSDLEGRCLLLRYLTDMQERQKIRGAGSKKLSDEYSSR